MFLNYCFPIGYWLDGDLQIVPMPMATKKGARALQITTD